MHIGEEMEIKEHEAFESVFTAENGWDLTCINGCYQNIGTFKAFAGWKAAKEHATPEGFVLLPIEPTKAIRTALSYQCFDFIAVAQVYRKLGFDIPKKAEDEQSFFLHKFLILAIEHDDFIKVFNAETKAMIEAQEQSHD